MTTADLNDPLEEEHDLRDSIIRFLESMVERYGEQTTAEVVEHLIAAFKAEPNSSKDLEHGLIAARAVRSAG